MNRRRFLFCAASTALLMSAVVPFAEASERGRSVRTIDGQSSWVRSLIFHYTAVPYETALKMLTDPKHRASAHYLIADADNNGASFTVQQLVAETKSSAHAGRSYWQGSRMLNASSIGIEVVNLGYPSPEQDQWPLMSRHWYSYEEGQIAVVARLARTIIDQHGIPASSVVGHADVSPGRKVDPGPLFPWERLYREFGVGAWPEAEAIEYYRTNQPYAGDVRQLQAKLLNYGYDTPQTGQLDPMTLAVVAAFQMHFRPAKYDGQPDIETVAVLDALLEKYFNHRNDSRKR
ncbi:N-acetylmuramoyl-L-alanine amidase [Neisseriaceae bacterium TC5R-5]|nr:N-acetylmuramoyl-L-alanine amidase [Neisseriaceae bacterium TC5R-5]